MRRFQVKRKLPKHQIIVAIFVGVASGFYIWKPLFEKYLSTNEQSIRDELTTRNKPVKVKPASTEN